MIGMMILSLIEAVTGIVMVTLNLYSIIEYRKNAPVNYIAVAMGLVLIYAAARFA